MIRGSSSSALFSMAIPFVAVHAGAGYHSDSSCKDLKDLCKAACRDAIKALKDGKGSSEATAIAIGTLEDSPLTNAGLGSNLTLAGKVECDASVMDGRGEFGSVGGLQGVANPIKVALKLLEQSSEGCLSLGRVPPLMLVGEGARLWAKQQGMAVCNADELITERAQEVYLDHKSRLDEVTQQPPTKKRRTKHDSKPVKQLDSQGPLDTVGAICIDSGGDVSAGVSSGGISLKFPGRTGQAAMFGCGCWADSNPSTASRAVASSTSGTGEYIIKTMLARECAIAMVDATLQKALQEKFLDSKSLAKMDQKLAGVIAVSLLPNGHIHFSWGHTTESMCIGYMHGSRKEPSAFISKTECPDKVGKSVQVEGLTLTARD